MYKNKMNQQGCLERVQVNFCRKMKTSKSNPPKGQLFLNLPEDKGLAKIFMESTKSLFLDAFSFRTFSSTSPIDYGSI